MTSRTLVAVIALVAPAAAFAQVSHSRAYITGPVVVPNEPAYVVPAQPYPSACTDLQDRRAMLDDEKVTYDRERDQLDAENAQLTQELRNLDSRDSVAVAAYNARSDDHNRRVAAHNRRVAEMNDAVARLTSDLANAQPYCRFAWNGYTYVY
ncbi:MAG TPA: hypothetical protein VN782_03610 [Usitatibacter sp.]|nr:hypothetical protein [Usitatibacter sp.]